MKLLLLLFGVIVYTDCSSQQIDTLLAIPNTRFLLSNVYGAPPLSVGGDLYVTSEQLVFHPKPYRKKRYEMYTSLVKDFSIQYDSIITAKKGMQQICGLEVKTKTITYQFELVSSLQKPRKKKLREIVRQVNELMKK